MFLQLVEKVPRISTKKAKKWVEFRPKRQKSPSNFDQNVDFLAYFWEILIMYNN